MTKEHTRLANTIVEQLGGEIFLNQIGVGSSQEIRLFCLHLSERKEKGIKFRIESTENKSNYTTCIITLQENDTYRVIFYKGIFGYKTSCFEQIEDVYNDDFTAVFKECTGIEIPRNEEPWYIFDWE